MANFRIKNKEIGDNKPCFIIAEISANHNQSFERAKELVKRACQCGVDAVKLQTYTPDTMTIDFESHLFRIRVNSAWKGKTLYQLYKEAHMPWEWQPELKKIAESQGKVLFSTAYDETSVDFLEKIDVPAYKIASFELTDIEFLKKVAQTGKPVIISRGMSSKEELDLAVSTLKEHGASNVAVLHCVSTYPAKPEEMNLMTIPDIKKKFGTAGLSDHTLSNDISIAGVALGADIIEKHFTLSRFDKGPDSAFSLEPKELESLVKSIRTIEKAKGRVCYELGKGEAENIVLRRSLFAVKNIEQGEELTRENIRSIRPSYGLEPKYINKVIGRKASTNIKKGTPLNYELHCSRL